MRLTLPASGLGLDHCFEAFSNLRCGDSSSLLAYVVFAMFGFRACELSVF